MTVCKNCNHEFKGKFCTECGQKAKTGRITIRQVMKDLQGQFIHFDQGFLFTIKELMFRPGHTIREYLEGKRVKHVKPLRFMFWATAISFVVVQYFGFQERLMQRIEQQPNTKANSSHMGQKLIDLITAHPSLLMLFILPTIAFCSWLFFRKKGYNYAEHFTICTFLLGELSLLNIALSSFTLLVSDFSIFQIALLGSIQWLLWMTYFGWAYRQFFHHDKKFKTWILGFLVIICGYSLMILLIGLFVSGLLYFFKPQIDAWMAN